MEVGIVNGKQHLLGVLYCTQNEAYPIMFGLYFLSKMDEGTALEMRPLLVCIAEWVMDT